MFSRTIEIDSPISDRLEQIAFKDIRLSISTRLNFGENCHKDILNGIFRLIEILDHSEGDTASDIVVTRKEDRRGDFRPSFIRSNQLTVGHLSPNLF